MQIIVIGSDSANRANILEVLAKIKPEFSVMFIEKKTSTEDIKAIAKVCDLDCTDATKTQVKELVALPPYEDIYVPPEKPKYTCKGKLKRR